MLQRYSNFALKLSPVQTQHVNVIQIQMTVPNFRISQIITFHSHYSSFYDISKLKYILNILYIYKYIYTNICIMFSVFIVQEF